MLFKYRKRIFFLKKTKFNFKAAVELKKKKMRILLVLVLIELNHAARIKNQDSNDPLTEWNKFKTENSN